MPATLKKTNFLFKAVLLLCFILITASNVSALPSKGDEVTMHYYGDYPYVMEHAGDMYDVFCVEVNEYFSDGGTYKVESVGDYATLGGAGGDLQYWAEEDRLGDPVSDYTKLLYIAYQEGLIVSASNVQHAIWFLEGENDSYESYWTNLQSLILGLDLKDYQDWVVVVANLVQYDTSGNVINRQSQLIGSPVPEPATLMLLGTGLLGIGFATRKKIKK